MGHPVPVVERAMEVQVAIRGLRTQTHPLWEAALATGNWTLLSECRALAGTLRVAATQARRITGLAEARTTLADAAAAPQRGAGVIADATQPAIRRGRAA